MTGKIGTVPISQVVSCLDGYDPDALHVDKAREAMRACITPIADTELVAVRSSLGRVLGPAGKMPNPKVGTVTMDVAKAVEESKSGKIEYRTDRTAIVHLVIGKASFDEAKLLENYATVVDELLRAKPSAAKGRYLRSITLSSTMGPGVKVDTSAKVAPSAREGKEEAPATAAA